MGAAAGAIGGAASLAALGLSAYSSIEKGKAGKAADEFQASRLERAAEYGRVAAAQTSAVLTERLNTTLGNIEAVRAAGHTDPTSPTGVAIEDRASYLGERTRNIQVSNILGQVTQEESDAAYMRYVGTQSLLSGYLGAAIDVAGGLGKGAAQPTFGLPGKTPQYAPDDL